jgi:phosphatidylglycerol lysyltransferase
VAFASIWASADRSELSANLMRFRADAPKETMEALFVHLMQWGKTEHYKWFNLGMAPLSGFEQSSIAPLWNRFGAFIFEHVGGLYNFQGLRAFKEKFRPVWEPRYLVYPGGPHLAYILADVFALIAGGYRKILLK